MDIFLHTISSFPTVIYTLLLLVVLAYWLFTIVTGIDIELPDMDVDLDLDATGAVGGIAAFLSAFGLGGIPLTLVFSVVVLSAWAVCYALMQLCAWLPFAWLQWLAGVVVLVLSFFLGLWIAARVLRPFRHALTEHKARNNSSFVGLECEVRTLKVTETFGQGRITQGSNQLTVNIRASQPNQFTKGMSVVLARYDSDTQVYWIEDKQLFSHLTE